MRRWKNQTKKVLTRVALTAMLFGQLAIDENNKEIYVENTIGYTQNIVTATTEAPVDVDQEQQIGEESVVTEEGGWEAEDGASGYATEFKDEQIMHTSYYKYGQGCLTVEIVKEDLEVTTNSAIAISMNNSGVISSQQLLDACFTEAEKAELESGVDKSIRVKLKQMVEEGLSSKQYEILDEAMETYQKEYKGLEIGSYIKVNISKSNDEGKWKKIPSLNTELKLVMDIPKISQISEARGYYLIQLREKEDTYTIAEDEDDYLEIITAPVSGSAMCAIGYQLPVVEKPVETIQPTENPGYWTRMTSGGEYCFWHFFELSILIIAVTWLLAVDSRKVRTVLFTVISILCIILGMFGHCTYDWPITNGCIVIMAFTHVIKTVVLKKNKKM